MTGDTLQTEFPFTLPNGFVSEDGTLHREGQMRLATAADEILPLKDPRVRSNESYLTVILLSRVLTSLGSLPDVTPQTVENLFVADLAYLQDMYERVNDTGMDAVDATCPDCGESFAVAVGGASGDRRESSDHGDSRPRNGDQPTERDEPPETGDAQTQPTETDGGRDHHSDARTVRRPADDPGGGSGNRHSPTAGSRSGESGGTDRGADRRAAGRSSRSSVRTHRDDPA
jgi:hypothetical protein